MCAQHTTTSWQAGSGKAIITGFVPHIGMMGYGMHFHTVKGKQSELYARTLLIKHSDSGKFTAIVIAELCFITLAVRQEVITRLRHHHPQIELGHDNLLLSAQHTHSGPGGYSHYGFYNLTIPGFVPQVFDEIVNGIVESIAEAWASLKPARLFFQTSSFDENQQVAFNRSLDAYNTNPEVSPKIRKGEEHKAVDRTMKMLIAEDLAGKCIGLFNWFAVHTTSLHNDNHLISSDNKGYAATIAEEELLPDNPGMVAAFGQGSAGDISPNYWYDKKKKWTRGKYEDDFQSAEWNGRQQANLALSALRTKNSRREIHGMLDFGLCHSDFSQVICNPAFTTGAENARTSPACLGVSFFAGTAEGPGMPRIVAFFARRLTTLLKGYEYFIGLFQGKNKRTQNKLKYKVQSPKHILVEAGERRVLATSDIKNLIFPGFLDKSLGTFKQHHRRGALSGKPWVPQVLPLQIIILGDTAFAAIPAETTTIAGKRLRETALAALERRGVKEVVLCPYSNGYCGYITTQEEYMLQLYEGGHTVFGKWTLAAFQTRLQELAEEMVKQSEMRKIPGDTVPDMFSPEELKNRTWTPDQNKTHIPA